MSEYKCTITTDQVNMSFHGTVEEVCKIGETFAESQSIYRISDGFSVLTPHDGSWVVDVDKGVDRLTFDSLTDALSEMAAISDLDYGIEEEEDDEAMYIVRIGDVECDPPIKIATEEAVNNG